MSSFLELQNEVLAHQLNDTKYRSYVKQWLNEGQRYIVLQADIRSQHELVSIALSANDRYTPFPDDFARLIELADATTDTDWTILTPIDRLRDFDDAPDAFGAPLEYIAVGTVLYLYPVPDVDTTLALSYYRLPAEMVADADEPEIPEQYHHLLVRYALIRAFQRENDYDAATYWRTEFDNDLIHLRTEAQYDTADPPKVVRGTWGDASPDPNVWY